MHVTIEPAALDEVKIFLHGALEHDTSGGAQSVRDLAAGSQLFKVMDESGRIVAGYALQLTKHELKTVAYIVACGGRMPGVDLARTLLGAIQQQAKMAGAQQIALVTRRPGLIRKMQSCGMRATGIVMRGDIA